jgi:peptidoglycan/LPS O-acetylase OafA/YrhL
MLPLTNTTRNYLIDLLRFLSASWVALFHFNVLVPFHANWYRYFCGLGYLGVPVFFIISGYCICIAQQHSKTPRSFIVRRIFRIFPPYWFSILLVCACAMAMKIITGTNSTTTLPTSFSSVIATIFLYTAPLSSVHTINWVYWTLPYELFFYLLVFLSMAIGKKVGMLFLVILALGSIWGPSHANGIFFFFNELPAFLLGYALYLLLNRAGNLYLSLSMLLLAATGVYLKHSEFAYHLTYFVTCVLIVLNHRFPLKNNWFSRLGDYSYSVYLIHVPVGIYLLGFIKNNHMVQCTLALNILADLLLLVLVIGCSKIMFLKVEEPSIKLGRKFSS